MKSGREAGFTLIEVVVALAIVGAAVLLVAPMTRTSLGPQALRGAASEIAALARSTRAAALRSGVERVMIVDLASRTVWADGVSGPRAIPAHLGLDVAVAADGVSGGQQRHIRFLPTGGASGGSIVLRDGVRTTTIEIDWLTGGARVATLAP